MTIAQLTAALRPTPRLSINAKYRYSDVDAATPIFERTGGSVAYDSSFAAAAAPSEYLSVKRVDLRRRRRAAGAALDLDQGRLQPPRLRLHPPDLGARPVKTCSASRSTPPATRWSACAACTRTASGNGEDLDPGVLAEVGELAGMRHFDVADRDRQRLTLVANLIPAGIIGAQRVGRRRPRRLPRQPHGLQSFDSNQYSVGVSRDARRSLQPDGELRVGTVSARCSGRATPPRPPTRSIRFATGPPTITGKVNFLEAALDLNGVIERTLIRLSVDWNRSNDTYLYGLVTGSPLAVPEQLPPVKNELFRGEIAVNYEISRNLSAGVTYWFDDYQVEDFALGPTTLTGIALPPVQEGQPIVATNALLLGYLYRPYTAHVGFVRLTYRF